MFPDNYKDFASIMRKASPGGMDAIEDLAAERLGIARESITDIDEFAKRWSFVHEHGHAMDLSGNTLVQFREEGKQMQEEIARMRAHLTPPENLNDLEPSHPQRYAHEYKVQEIYKKTRSETAADDFATQFFKKNPEFLSGLVKPPPPPGPPSLRAPLHAPSHAAVPTAMQHEAAQVSRSGAKKLLGKALDILKRARP
jgi:hypothetical protein